MMCVSGEGEGEVVIRARGHSLHVSTINIG